MTNALKWTHSLCLCLLVRFYPKPTKLAYRDEKLRLNALKLLTGL